MRIWVISGASRSRPDGSISCCPSLLINYFGQGALVLVPSRRDRKFLLPDGSGDTAAAAGRAGDRGDRDRQPGGDHGSLFADPPGGAARSAAALRGPLHLGDPCRADLSAAREQAAADRRVAAGAVVPHLERPGLRLWHRGLHHHGRRRHHGLCGDLEVVELARGDRCGADRAVCRRRHDLLQRQSVETARRRLGAAAVRRWRWRS